MSSYLKGYDHCAGVCPGVLVLRVCLFSHSLLKSSNVRVQFADVLLDDLRQLLNVRGRVSK